MIDSDEAERYFEWAIEGCIKECMHIIQNLSEDDVNCESLKALLNLEHGKTVCQKIVYSCGYGDMTLAAAAICYNKTKFFEITVCKESDALVATKNKQGGSICSPLICAINMKLPSLVTTVLRNFYFIADSFEDNMDHVTYLCSCINYAKSFYGPRASVIDSNEREIMNIFNRVLEFRVPLIFALKASNLEWIRLIFTSTSFHPEIHKTIVEDCLLMVDWCEQDKDEIRGILKNSIGL